MTPDPTILILDDIPAAVGDYVEEKGYKTLLLPSYDKSQLLDVIDKAVAIIYRAFTAEFDEDILRAGEQLKMIVRTGGGMGKIDQQVAKELGIELLNTVGCNSYTAAEFIFASFMNLARKLTYANTVFRSGAYDRNNLWSSEVTGKTVGIIGFGRMGKFLSKMCKAFDMKVLANSPHITREEELEYGIQSVTLEELYHQSDFISIAFPASVDFKGMFDHGAFKLMKDGVHLVNMTWMGLFQEDDLVEALKSGKIGGIVMERPSFDPSEGHVLMDFDNVVFTPAIGSHSLEGQFNCGKQAADIVFTRLLQV